MDDFSGKTIRGYGIHERIRASRFSTVYRAHETITGREVAIGVLHRTLSDGIHRSYVERKARRMACLVHPNIVPVYDSWWDENRAFWIMPYLSGGTVYDKLRATGPLSLDEAEKLVDTMASVLDYVHDQGIVHRNLSPSNILLDEKGNFYIGGFGIHIDLNADDEEEDLHKIIGRMSSVPPIEANPRSYTLIADVYYFGVVLYEVLTGEPPFTGEPVEIIYRHLSDPLPDLPDNLPNGLNAIIQKATAKNPAQRYQDVCEIATEFRQVIDGKKSK